MSVDRASGTAVVLTKPCAPVVLFSTALWTPLSLLALERCGAEAGPVQTGLRRLYSVVSAVAVQKASSRRSTNLLVHQAMVTVMTGLRSREVVIILGVVVMAKKQPRQPRLTVFKNVYYENPSRSCGETHAVSSSGKRTPNIRFLPRPVMANARLGTLLFLEPSRVLSCCSSWERCCWLSALGETLSTKERERGNRGQAL